MTDLKFKSVHIDELRNFSDIDFDLGNRMTVISGVNGIGKSFLLSLIVSTTGTFDRKLTGGNFHPDFFDFFKIEPNPQKYKKYSIYVSFNQKDFENHYLTKKIRFANYSNAKRGIRVLPKTSNYKIVKTNKEVDTEVRKKFGIGLDARVPIPTIYLSLSRILPLGEEEIEEKKLNSRSNSIFKNGYYDFYTKCYNSVFPNSIDSSAKKAAKVKRSFIKDNYLNAQVRNTTTETQSVGQGNLSRIISSLTNFYALKQELGDQYRGGILCIDEVDATLHPSAVIALLKCLDEQSKELNLQILLTTHSLTALKYIINLQNREPENYQLVYFVDNKVPRINVYDDYNNLKADLLNENLPASPKIKIYFEDQTTQEVFNLLIDCGKKTGKIKTKIEANQIPIHLGNTNLKGLQDSDEYFKKVVMILDGDAKLRDKKIDNTRAMHDIEYKQCKNLTPQENNKKNIAFLPGFFPPEVFLYNIFEEYTTNAKKHNSFWKSLGDKRATSITTVDSVIKKLKISKKTTFEDIHEKSKWFEEAIKFVKDSDILINYYNDSRNKHAINEFEGFLKQFKSAEEIVLKKISSQLFD
ncbi:AAA family ATPase [Lactobacillus apis]|uniref:Endonuclease GajA/Old nuclease/RecF-like AAA domain-containing protein n=1 Tax=Lactobacillus apis TaxID=303541 RepID=A0A0F4LSP5_9LACO|nr:AAA family ATPase [Lactobacillus apis]KJY61585.1 hypothetical protein JF72_08780 [Lactobacillus apis]